MIYDLIVLEANQVGESFCREAAGFGVRLPDNPGG